MLFVAATTTVSTSTEKEQIYSSPLQLTLVYVRFNSYHARQRLSN